MDGKELRKRLEDFEQTVGDADGCVNDYGVEVDVCLGGGPNAGGVTIQVRLSPDTPEISIRLRPNGTYEAIELA